ncbi:MAG: PQQ-binding-like beta-propeller repeat protein [Emergencia sp.]
MRRNIRKLSVLLLCMTVIFAFTVNVSAAADPSAVITEDWSSFRGNSENNAVTDAKVPVSPSDAMLYWASKNGSGWSAAPGSPILVDGYLYFNAGTELIKMDAVSGEIAAKGTMTDRSPFSICPPAYGDGKIFVGLANGVIQAFDAKTLKSLWIYTDALKGQPNTPITYCSGYIYAGFWNSETRDANFVCLSTSDPDKSKTKEAKSARWTYTSKGGFYWAGAYACSDFVLVGTDDGESGCDSQTSRLIAFSPKTGKVLDEITGLDGDIRSSVSYDKTTDRYYFTSKGGTFYSVSVSAEGKISGLKSLDLGGMSTSTPAVYNGRAYVGVAGSSQFSKYSGHNISVIDLAQMKVAYKAATMGYPQTSGMVVTAYEETDGCVYVLFFENYTPGKLRIIRDKPGQTKVDRISSVYGEGENASCADTLFTPAGSQAQYAICSPIADEYGTIYFKNDSCYMMALGSRIESLEVTRNPTRSTYDIGETGSIAGIRVKAHLANGMTRDVSDYVTCATEPVEEGQQDLTVFYPYAMYNDDGEAEPVFTSVDIKVNSKAVSAKNAAAKKAIKASRVSSVKVTAGKKKATVTWKKVSGATGYQVSRATSKNGTYKVMKTTTSLKYTNTSLTSGKTYYYKVRAYRTINGVKYYGKWSVIKSVKVK